MVHNDPSLANPGWLPEGRWPRVDKLREEHALVLEPWWASNREINALRRAHEAEDAERAEALKEAYRTGSDPADAPSTTPEADRAATLKALEDRRDAAAGALDAFLRRAIEEIKANEPELAGALAAEDAKADEARAEARRILAEADAGLSEVRRAENWLRRTVRDVRGFHLAYEDVPTPIVDSEADAIGALAGRIGSGVVA